MKNIKYLILFLIIFSNAQARKPAVEDFVGVEPQEYSRTPQGTEVLFEFENIVKANAQAPTSEIVSTLVLFAFICLPFLMWFSIIRLSKKDDSQTLIAEVKSLNDYKESRKTDEEIKKAS